MERHGINDDFPDSRFQSPRRPSEISTDRLRKSPPRTQYTGRAASHSRTSPFGVPPSGSSCCPISRVLSMLYSRDRAAPPTVWAQSPCQTGAQESPFAPEQALLPPLATEEPTSCQPQRRPQALVLDRVCSRIPRPTQRDRTKVIAEKVNYA